ncbi:TraR/DksA family transcriptional regulator [Candidatus Omnitrophota bacterium]
MPKKKIKPKRKKQAVSKKKKVRRMKKQEVKLYKTLLLKERADLSEEVSNIKRENLSKSQKDASGDLSGYAYHMADVASDSYDREFSLGLASTEQKRLFEIDDALKRIEEGTYGTCLSCEKAIAKKRLKAIPHTGLCIECQKSQETKK